MHNEWISFLQDQQAIIDEQGRLSFASGSDETRAVSEASIIADLSPLGVIRVTGEDATDFLQGQFSNDIQQLDEQTAQLSSYCNPKGRILASFWIYRHNDAFYMLLPADTLAATLKRLRMYVLMSKVTLEDASEELACIGLAGPGSEQALQQQLGAALSETANTIHHNGISVIRLP
ncbi:MAG: folate-binding protein, partial [Gammaproteobacteria bacterium]|nr:folate-binding protein [Gammaproteobacteria bacterium]